MRALSIKKVQKIGKERGLLLLSKRYKNSHELLAWKCKNGHKFKMALNNLKYGQRCSECNGIKKYLKSEITDIAKKKCYKIIGVLPSKIKAKTKLQFKCKCGKKFSISAYKLRIGRGCQECNKRKYSNDDLIIYLKNLFKKLGRPPTHDDINTDNEGPDSSTLFRRLGGRNKAFKLTGIEIGTVTEQDCLNEIKRVAKYLGHAPTADEYIKVSIGPSIHVIKRKVGWTNALDLLGYGHRQIWTDFLIYKTAKKFKSRAEFNKAAPGCYGAAKRRGIIAKVCTHMMPQGSKYLREIYAYEFKDRSVYVGLTYNFEERNSNHIRKSKWYLTKKRQNICYKIVRNGKLLLPEDAATQEAMLIEKYQASGWTVLNKIAAGGLGGSWRLWNIKSVEDAILKCSTIKEFTKKYPGAYQWAHKNNKWERLSNSLQGERKKKGYWTQKRILEEARRYHSRSEFNKGSPSAYRSAKSLGILHLAFKHMGLRKLITTNKWNKDAILKVSKKFKRLSDLRRKYPSAVDAAKRLGILDDIIKKYEFEITPGYWTEERVKDEAMKHKYRSDFLSKARGAYGAAKKYGILNEVCKHMKMKTRS